MPVAPENKTDESTTPAQTVNVIVPVYRGVDATRRCVESVLQTRKLCTTPFELILINDASPDSEITYLLAEYRQTSGITLLANAENQGFVGTVNRGMACHPDRDVVLLNSDAEVANDWLDRLVATATAHPEIATLTPWSNNATICSYPYPHGAHAPPGRWSTAEFDQLVANTLKGAWLEIPTAVGFCMFIRRACLDEIGAFDQALFGKGYGEENEFSLRAKNTGWVNALAGDVYVAHTGGVSFADSQSAHQQQGAAALNAVYPEYDYLLGQHQQTRDIAALATCLDEACARAGQAVATHALPAYRTATFSCFSPAVNLIITHSWGGGIQRWVDDLCKHEPYRRQLVLRSVGDRNCAAIKLELLEPAVAEQPLAVWPLAIPIAATDLNNPVYQDIISQIVRGFDVQAVFIASLIGHALNALYTHLPTVVVTHDLYPLCPTVFAYKHGQSCHQCQLADLSDCAQYHPGHLFWHVHQPEYWLKLRSDYIHGVMAEHIQLAAPTRSVKTRVLHLAPELNNKNWHIIPHGTDCTRLPQVPNEPSQEPRGRLRVVVPGRLAAHKGLALLESLLPKLDGRIELYLLGTGPTGRQFDGMQQVWVLEDYQPEQLEAELTRIKPDMAMLLSTTPESFSYTLSEMHGAGLPVLAIEQGAFAERITPEINGWLCPPEPSEIAAQLQQLLNAPERIAHAQQHLHAYSGQTVADMLRAYRDLLPQARPGRVAQVQAMWAAQAQRTQVGEVECQSRIDGHEQAVSDALNMQRQLEQTIAELTASRSWRITEPLRRVGGWLRQLRGAHKPAEPEIPSAQPQNSTEQWPVLTRQYLHWGLGIPDRARLCFVPIWPNTDPQWNALQRLADELILPRNGWYLLMVGDESVRTQIEDHPMLSGWFLQRKLLFFPEARPAEQIQPLVQAEVDWRDDASDLSSPARLILHSFHPEQGIQRKTVSLADACARASV